MVWYILAYLASIILVFSICWVFEVYDDAVSDGGKTFYAFATVLYPVSIIIGLIFLTIAGIITGTEMFLKWYISKLNYIKNFIKGYK